MINLLPPLVVLSKRVGFSLIRKRSASRKARSTASSIWGRPGGSFSCLLCWIVAFPAYLVKRRTYQAGGHHGPTVRWQSGSDLMSQLGALADLYAQGLLTEQKHRGAEEAAGASNDG